jgi:hypothetical protein
MEHAVVVTKAGRKSAEGESFPIEAKSDESDQSADNQQFMSLEIALARALQQLVSKPENRNGKSSEF